MTVYEFITIPDCVSQLISVEFQVPAVQSKEVSISFLTPLVSQRSSTVLVGAN